MNLSELNKIDNTPLWRTSDRQLRNETINRINDLESTGESPSDIAVEVDVSVEEVLAIENEEIDPIDTLCLNRTGKN